MSVNVYPDHPTSTSLGTPFDTPVLIKNGKSFPGGQFVSLAGNVGNDPSYFNLPTTFIRISMSLGVKADGTVAPASTIPPQIELQAVAPGSSPGATVTLDPTNPTHTSPPGVALNDSGNIPTEAASAYFVGPFVNNVYLIKVIISIPSTTINMRLTNNMADGLDHDFVWVVSSNDDITQSDSAQQPWIQLTPFAPFGVLVNTTASANTQALLINNRGTGTLTVKNIASALTAPYKLNPNGVLNSGLPSTVAPNPASLANILIGVDAPATKGPIPLTNYTVDGDSRAVSGAAHNNAFSLSGNTSAIEVAMLLDTSGSMAATDTSTPGASRLTELQSAAGQVLSYLSQFAAGAGNKIGVVQFPGTNPLDPGTFDVIPSEDIKSSMASEVGKINALTPTDSTPMDGGISEVLNKGYFSSDTTNARWLLLMSDGKWNVGLDPVTTELTNLVAKKIVVFAAGYGQSGQVDYKTLTDLSTGTGGQAYQVDLDASLTNPTYLALAKKFKSAVATGLALTSASDPDGVISPGGEDRYPVIITPYDRKAVFSLNWQTPNAGLTLTLLTPTCDVITPGSKIPGVTFISDPRYQMYGIDESYLQARHGTWRLIVSYPGIILEARPVAAAAPATGEHYSYNVLTDSSLKLRVELDKSTYFAGDTIGVTATVTAAGLPVTGASAQLSVTAPGQSTDNWLAGIPITAAEYQNAAAQLAGKDAWPVYIKAFAAQLKGLKFDPASHQTTFPMTPIGPTGAYFASVNQTTIPDGHTLYVTVTGTTFDGIVFRRDASVDVHLGVLPDLASTLFNVAYTSQNNPRVITGVVSVTPRDRFGNVILIDPATSQYIQLQVQGATLDPKLATTFNGTYTSNVTYAAGTNPTFSLIVGGQPVFTNQTIVPVDRFNWVNEVVSFKLGGEAAPGANQHKNPNDALGDIRTRPANTFAALGSYGSLAVAIKGQNIQAQGDDDITVFIESTLVPRSYLVEALPPGADGDNDKDDTWVKIGTSPGGTSSFGLRKGGLRAASAIRITDTSGLTRDSQFKPLPDPGAGVIAVGVKSAGKGDGGDGDGGGICIQIRVLNPAGQPLGGTVDIEFQPQNGGQTTKVTGADASKDIDVSGLARFPQVSVYEVTVTPTDVFKPTGQFVTIPASGFNTVVFTIAK
jgi:hypothetical protein